ncbi:Carbamoyl-phosphate synthase small chain [Candidatus Lokiarchaeum ossiferum]|uniref:Carbamoyl-phosphate synthase small chain n=1 Tax=Candidatus Lokiarchaeum ossiferum TaxID=2951803 RepID=A0ABY6HWC2_9ARCH|nr:Carbamoyl-phosphate synthase small chain [Candidatus Lokiarchaeum sp. B-35]
MKKRIAIIDNFDKENEKFKTRFDNTLKDISNIVSWNYFHYSSVGESAIIEKIMNCDGIILTGSYNMLSEESTVQKYASVTKILHDYSKPVFGICFGHQLIASLYGFVTGPLNHPDDDIEDEKTLLLNLFSPYDLIKGDSILAYETHHQEVKYVPEYENEFKIFASSEVCKIQLVKHKTRPLYGAQFHPENPSNPEALKQGIEMIHNFVKLL